MAWSLVPSIDRGLSVPFFSSERSNTSMSLQDYKVMNNFKVVWQSNVLRSIVVKYAHTRSSKSIVPFTQASAKVFMEIVS